METPKPQNPEEIQFALATKADIGDILEIQRINSLQEAEAQEKTKDEIERAGLLVHLLTEEEIEELLEQPENVSLIVCRENNEVVGYAVGYKMKFWKDLHPGWIDSVKFTDGHSESDISDEKSVYFRHVATSSNATPGTGKKISNELVRQSIENGYSTILGEILKEPYENKPSLVMHKRIGFKEMGEIEEDYEGVKYKWGLFEKELNQE